MYTRQTQEHMVTKKYRKGCLTSYFLVCEFFGERAQFEVTVKAAPYWEAGKPMDVTENEDDSAELHCFANGSPRPLIRWFMNGVALHGS